MSEKQYQPKLNPKGFLYGYTKADTKKLGALQGYVTGIKDVKKVLESANGGK